MKNRATENIFICFWLDSQTLWLQSDHILAFLKKSSFLSQKLLVPWEMQEQGLTVYVVFLQFLVIWYVLIYHVFPNNKLHITSRFIIKYVLVGIYFMGLSKIHFFYKLKASKPYENHAIVK